MKFFGICLAAALATTAAQAAPVGPAKPLMPTGSPLLPVAPRFLEDAGEGQFNLNFSLQPAAAGSLTVVFNYRSLGNFLALDLAPGSLGIRAVEGGKTRQLGRVAASWSNGQHITLQRRPWLIRVLSGGHVLATAFDAGGGSGKVGAAAGGGWAWSGAGVQPTEAVDWADDFTRLPGEKGDWALNWADWLLTSSSEEFSETLNRHHDQATRITMSANPFALRAKAPEKQVWAQAGHPFWDNYQAGVSVKPLGRGVVGLAVYVQDEKNYLAFKWSSTEGPEARQLVRVVDGAATTLASAPGAFLPRQWYRLSVQTSPGYLQAALDGTPVFSVADSSFGQGAVALLAHGLTADFDDARVTSAASFPQNLQGGSLGSAWQEAGGRWQSRAGVLTSSATSGDKGAPRLALAGDSGWDGYLLSTWARVGDEGAAGLVAGYRDPDNYLLFRWAAPSSPVAFRGRQQLVRYRKGRATVLRDEPAGDILYASQPLSVRLAGNALAVFFGERMVAQYGDAAVSPGRVGLWAQGAAPVSFENLAISFPPEPQAPVVTPKFAGDALMVGWAAPEGEWKLAANADGLARWNTGDFYGDAAIEYAWHRSPDTAQKVEVALRARRGEWDSGYVLRLEQVKPEALYLSLLRSGKVLQQTSVNFHKSDAMPLRVRLEGDGILASVAGEPVLTYVGSSDLSARRLIDGGGFSVGVRGIGFTLDANDLKAWGAKRDDYTFTNAPTDWYAPQGEWNVFSSWPCYADFSFFGGQGLNPVLWTKREYRGDTVAEMYVHPQMDLPKYPGYSRQGDLNITIAGDGRNPSSGYSFVVAGWNNSRTRILRGSTVVADNHSDEAWFHDATNMNNAFHRHWFYIRAEAKRAQEAGRSGVRLRLSVDETVLCDYFDPDPLAAVGHGGRVAIWTVDHGMMVARAKIESADPGPRSLPPGLLDAAAPLIAAAGAPVRLAATSLPNMSPAGGVALIPREVPAVSGSSGAFAQPEVAAFPAPDNTTPASALVTGDGASWTVRNPVAGGLFKVRLNDAAGAALAVTPATRLDLDLALPAAVHIDLYALIDGTPHLIQLTGPAPDDRVRLLGTAVSTPSGGDWKHFTFELGAALKKLYPDAAAWKVQELSIGALHGDAYRWLGFDGNPLGASYGIRNPRLLG